MNKYALSPLAFVLIAQGAFAQPTLVTAYTKSDFISYVSSDSPYDTVTVAGKISGLSNVILKDGLTLKGDPASGGTLEAAPDAPLLVIGANNHIQDLILTLPNNHEGRAIVNKEGRSVQNLTLSHVTTNGIIAISLADGSTDSQLVVDDNTLNLAPYSASDDTPLAAIMLSTTHNSRLQVNSFSDNVITTSAQNNLGVYNYATTGSSIVYSGPIAHNHITTFGALSAGLYNYAHGGQIVLQQALLDNTITLNNAVFAMGVYNHSDHKGSLELKGDYLNNQILANDSKGFGFAFVAENDGEIHMQGAIQQNTAKFPTFASAAFFSQASDGSQVQFQGNNIAQNTFQGGDQAAILNRTMIDGIIDFGLGDSTAVTTALNAHNALTVNDDKYPKVTNDVSLGGVIK